MPKATSRQGRANKNGRVYNANHNFKQETRDQEKHIEHTRTQNNLYHRYGTDKGWYKESFDAIEYETERYRELYQDGLDAKNQRYMKNGHKERCKTIEDVYRSQRTAPQETIWQLDNVKSKMNPHERTRILVESANAVVNSLKREFPDNFIPLDLALHRDEGLVKGNYIGLDHIHFRCTFAVKDKDGNLVPNQNEALRQMGYELPKPDEKSGKFNNLSMSFSADIRERFYKELEARGIEIDREVKNPSQKHMETLEFKCEQLEKELIETENESTDRKRMIEKQQQTIEEQSRVIDGQNQIINEKDKHIQELEILNTRLEAENRVLSQRNEKAIEETTENEKKANTSKLEADKQQLRASKNAELAEVYSKNHIKQNKKNGTFTMNIGQYQEATSQVKQAEKILQSEVYTPEERQEMKREADRYRQERLKCEQERSALAEKERELDNTIKTRCKNFVKEFLNQVQLRIPMQDRENSAVYKYVQRVLEKYEEKPQVRQDHGIFVTRTQDHDEHNRGR